MVFSKALAKLVFSKALGLIIFLLPLCTVHCTAVYSVNLVYINDSKYVCKDKLNAFI